MSDHGHDHGHQHGPGAASMADAAVRTGRPSDAPAVGLVQAAVWSQRYAGRLPDAVVAAFTGPAFGSVWRRSLAEPPAGTRLLVATAGDQVVGYASLEQVDDAMDVLDLGVHPQARRVGHGSRLLNAVADTARGAGASALHSWLPADDEAARQFAGQAGFGPDGAWRDTVVGPEGQTLRQVRLVAGL